MGRRRKIALENLSHAFPEKTGDELKSITRGSFRNYGITLTELLWFPNLNEKNISSLLEVKNPELMIAAYNKGKGIVMLSGHFGNWELIAFGVALISRLPVTIIVQKQSNNLVDKIINKHRCLYGNRVFPMGMSVREVVKALKGGGIVAIAPDQSGPMEGIYVKFFGRMVATHSGPAVLALRAGAPVQIGFIIRRDDMRYEIFLEEVPTADLPGHSDESVKILTQRHTALLEKYIRIYPDHWLWMHRRWKHLIDAKESL